MKRYDEFRVEAVFDDSAMNESIANDKINIEGLADEQIVAKVKEEIEETRKWWDNKAVFYIVTYYRDGEAVTEEAID